MIRVARSPKGGIVLVMLAILAVVHKHVNAQFQSHPTFITKTCYNDTGKYTENSPFKTNLHAVLSELASWAFDTRFYGSTVGNGTNTAYGVYYCRHDLSLQLCSDCVRAAALKALVDDDCNLVMQVAIYYQECTFRHSNEHLIGFQEDYPRGWSYDPNNVTDTGAYIKVLGTAMARIINTAAYGEGSEGFAVEEDVVTPNFLTLYALVQCRPDINGSLCQNCLQSLLVNVGSIGYYETQWMLFFAPSCQLRYGATSFFENVTFAPPAPLPSPLPPLLSTPSPSTSHVWHYVLRIGVPITAGILLLALLFGWWYCLNQQKNEMVRSSQMEEQGFAGNIECFDFKRIQSATMNFSDANKLGQGGFGSVYKATLENGQLVAVKRLARNSCRFIKEFKTEVNVVAKLQHRNLVRLLGFCVYQEERILVYEFLPNLSLDQFLFDTTKSFSLDWRMRYKIIEGIAWGLRYLHIDSLLTIIHRDLKSSNILLDNEMNPKIADFGLAKLVMVDETTLNTSTIAGTLGYMAPEYAMTGRFSIKSDMYSFGVMILEIVTGKSISQFFDATSAEGLLHYAWRHWNERAIRGIIDPVLGSNFSRNEVERCVHIGLLCVQDDMAKRPTIRVLLEMLNNQSLELPYPSAPTIFFHNTCNATSKKTNSPGRQSMSSQIELEHYSDESCPI